MYGEVCGHANQHVIYIVLFPGSLHFEGPQLGFKSQLELEVATHIQQHQPAIMASKKRSRPQEGSNATNENSPIPQPILDFMKQHVEKRQSTEAAIVDLIREMPVDIDIIKRLFYPEQLVSFSGAKYDKIAPLFNMNPGYRKSDWHEILIPRVSLSEDMKERILETGKKAIQQIGPPSRHENEHARNNFLSIVKSLFFQGYLTALSSPFSFCSGSPRLSHFFPVVYTISRRKTCPLPASVQAGE